MAEELPQQPAVPPHIMAAMQERMQMARAMAKIRHKIVVMSGKGGVGKCVRKGTQVLTGYGDWQAIEALHTPVIALDEEGQAVTREKKAMFGRSAHTRTLLLRSGKTLGLTDDHLVYTWGRWKPLRDLRAGDRLATIRWLPEPPGPDELTEHEAIVVGLLLGDGGLTREVPGFTNADPAVIEVLRDAVRRIDPVLMVRLKGTSRYDYRISKGRRGGKKNQVMALARRLGMAVHSFQKRLPPEVFRSSNRILALVLRGLFSTDGSVYDDKVEYASSSPWLAQDVQRSLLRFGIHSVLRARHPHYIYRGQRRTGRTAYRVLVLGGDILTFAARIGFWGRKLTRLRTTVAKIERRPRNPNLDTIPLEVWRDVGDECRTAGISFAQLSRLYGYARVPSTYGGGTYLKQGYLDRRTSPSRNTLRKIAELLESSRLAAIAESNIYWDRVVKIEDGGEDEVFDIEVEGSHNFIAEGVLVHNSTVAVNLAVTFAKEARVGIVDADVTGPDVPKILGVEDAAVVPGEKGLEPVSGVLGVKAVSMGLVLRDRDTPVIWRGPLKIKALKQMLMDVNWGELDYLIIDLPPGTSDEPLSIAQEIPDADGAVVVTTPQDVSLLDVRKSIAFAKAVNLPILGIVENMGGMVCPHCGGEIDVFKKGGGEAAAKELGLPFLGRIPLDPRIVVGGDAGKPFVLEHPDSPAAKAFARIVEEIKTRLPAPRTA